MADTILTVAFDLDTPVDDLALVHPVTGERLTPVAAGGKHYTVALANVLLPSPYPFKLWVAGSLVTALADILDLRPPVGPIGTSSAFRYSVPAGSNASAIGVFQAGTDNLVREIQGAQPDAAGKDKQGVWDGRLNDLSVAPAGKYDIRVLTHGITPTWEGPGYNTSWPASNLGTMQRGYRFIRSIVQSSNKDLHLVKDYTEAESFAVVLNPNDLDNRIELFPGFGVGTTSEFNATDGNNVYLPRLNRDKGNNTIMPSWATGYSATTRKLLSFSSGTSYAPDPNHPEQAESAINFLNPGDTSNIPTGIAVQRTGNLLFLPYSGNKVTVAHKLTGAVLGSTTLNAVSSGTVDGTDAPWFITAGAVTQYTANATTGALAAVGAPLPGLVDPRAISAYGDLIGVLDAGTSQQRKFYRASTRELLYTSPIAGGYLLNSAADPNRHYFSDLSGSAEVPSISLLADGSYWVVEPPLCRAQHFAADHSLIDQITYIDNAYRLALSQTNGRELFIKGLEFKIDETSGKPWPESLTLVAVWRATMPAQFFKLSNRKQNIEVSEFRQVSTLSNGRRYVWIKERENRKFCELELTATGVRLTPNFDTIPVSMAGNGDLYYANFLNNNKDYERRLGKLTGFDANNNPQRAAPTQIHLVRNIGSQAPVDYSGDASEFASICTQSGKLVFYYGGLMRLIAGQTYGYGYHMAVADPGKEGFTAQMAFSTPGAEYRGPYPTEGSQEVGNRGRYKVGEQMGYGGESVRAAGEFIYTNDPGEFWGPKGKQLAIHKLYFSNGLPVLVWGPTYKDADNSPTGYFPGMTGGEQMGELRISPTTPGVAYVYTIGEGAFGGPERWRLNGMDTVKTTTVSTVTVAADTVFPSVLPADTTNLLALAPARSNFQGGVAGFTQTPLTEDLSAEFGGSFWGVRTSIKKYDRFDTPDVFIRFRQQGKTNTFAFPTCLPAGTTSTSWQLRATLNFDEHFFNDGEQLDSGNSGGLYLDLPDQAGNVLVRFYLKANYAVSPSQATIYANKKVVATGLLATLGDVASLNADLLYTYESGALRVQYGAYPAVTLTTPFASGADFSAPGRPLVTCWDKGISRDRCVDISRLWFYCKPAPVSGPTFAPADASIGRVDLGAMQQTVNITSAAALKTALATAYTNTIIMVADGDYVTEFLNTNTNKWENFTQTGSLSNVLWTSAGGARFITANVSTNILLQGTATRTNFAFRNIKFESTFDGSGNPLLWSNELPTINGYEVSGCSFKSPNSSANGFGCVQYSTSSKQGQVMENVLIENNTFQDIGRCGIEMLSQGYDGVFRLFNLTIRKNTFANLGINNEYGMAVSLSGLFKQIDVSDNNASGTRRIAYEFVNAQQAIARNNNLSSSKDGVGYGFSDDSKGFTSDVWAYGGNINAAERPFYIYECKNIHLDGQGKQWKGGRGADMGTITGCTFDNLNLLIQSTAKESSWQWGSGCVGNTATNCTISSAGSAAAGRMPAYETVVVRDGATGNKLINCTTVLGTQANGQPFAPSPETGADGRIVNQGGDSNTITNNTRSVVA